MMKRPKVSQIVLHELSSQQFKTITCLVAANSIEEAAHEAHVSRSSIYRWLQEEGFCIELSRTREALFNETMARLQSATAASVTVLGELLKSRHEAIRLRAAGVILGTGLKAREIIDLGERIRRLEELVNGGGDDNSHVQMIMHRPSSGKGRE